MPVKLVSDFCHQDLVPVHQFYPQKGKRDPQNFSYPFDSQFPSSLRHLPTVAIYTLATLTVQGLPDPVWAKSGVDRGYQPEIFKQNHTDAAKLSTLHQATMTDKHHAIALPESGVKQEFTAIAFNHSELATAKSEEALPTFSIEPEIVSESKRTPNTQLGSNEIVSNSPHSPISSSLNSTELPLLNATDNELAIAKQERETSFTPPEQNVQTIVVPTSVTAVSRANIAPPETDMELDSNRVIETDVGTRIRGDAETINVLRMNATGNENVLLKAANLNDLRVAQQSVGQRDQIGIKTFNFPDSSTSTASPLSTNEVDRLQEELRGLEERTIDEKLRASPALSIAIPTAFGADNNTGFISATYQERTRFANVDDGALGIGIGLGDAQKSVGVELSYAVASFGSNRDFGSGGFNIKVHRRLPNDWAVAAGWNGFLNLGDDNDFEDSLYGVVSKIFRTREDINQPFSRVAVTAGVGNGQFRTEDSVDNDEGNINVFGNMAVRIAEPISLIAEWSGQDLGVGVSIAPFKNIPLVITPALRDITGAGDGTRFVLGMGFAFKF